MKNNISLFSVKLNGYLGYAKSCLTNDSVYKSSNSYRINKTIVLYKYTGHNKLSITQADKNRVLKLSQGYNAMQTLHPVKAWHKHISFTYPVIK